MRRVSSIRRLCVLGAATILAAFGQASQAQEASSDGYAIKASVNLLGVETLAVSPAATVHFDAQGTGFNDVSQLASLSDHSATSLITLSTGELTSETEYLPPPGGNPYGFAVVGTQASAANVDLGVLAAPPSSQSLLGVTATLLRSRAIVSGYCPPGAARPGDMSALNGVADNYIFNNGFDIQNLQATGGSDGFNDNGSAGIGITSGGVPLATLPLDPGANQTLGLSLLGATATLILNEQNFTGDGIASRGMEANALHLSLDSAVLDVELVIAHSQASLSCP